MENTSDQTPITDNRTIVTVFEGPAVQRGRVPVSEFVRVLDGIQRTLLLVGQELMGRPPTRGPVPQTYTDQLSLELVSTEPGSFKATIALAEQKSDELVNIGEAALERVIQGIDLEAHGGDGNPFLSESARLVVRDSIIKAVAPETRLLIQGGRQRRTIVITDQTPMAFPNIVRFAPRSRARLVGRLLEVDFKDRTAEVYDSTGKMTRIRFSEDLSERIKAASKMQVVAEGESEVDDQGRTRSFELQDLSVVDIPDEFWTNARLEDLIQQQGVKPIASLKDFASPSFGEDDADEMLEELRGLN